MMLITYLTICTRSASAIRSRVLAMSLCSVQPGRSAANKTSAENNPSSVSLKPQPLSPFVKFVKAVTNSI